MATAPTTSLIRIPSLLQYCALTAELIRGWRRLLTVMSTRYRHKTVPPTPCTPRLRTLAMTETGSTRSRRYIQSFTEISRLLGVLTKKGDFTSRLPSKPLKKSLATPPGLKQADGSGPYIVRTDASNYALGAVLLRVAAIRRTPH
ncbi:hypothetical protein CDAR_606121 [Caerostris darwini]|uniref:Reverse transcriptase/retrotransposon-derived protein RNase H-like domain-containing protein n=1 Tax=Caerostris darwini TaxID=1538125 RepID=A0AAV4NPT8_9ARAC|nr:hypothetical protein CDAR_606121 [Caerostris darwini]